MIFLIEYISKEAFQGLFGAVQTGKSLFFPLKALSSRAQKPPHCHYNRSLHNVKDKKQICQIITAPIVRWPRRLL